MKLDQMNGFTDIHTHILPQTDDGAKDLQEARALIRLAYEDGTRTIFLTPHYRGKFRQNTPELLRQKYENFCQAVREEFPDMKLYLGSEIHYQTEVPERLESGKILSLCDSQYVLLEFSTASMRSQITRAVSETVRYGFTPIIAHAERYTIFRKDASLTNEVLNMGALIQLNADSVMGKHGFGVKWFCRGLLKTQRVHFIASDAHDSADRPPLLRKCYLHVHKKYGGEYADCLFMHNAQAVIENQMI